MSDFVNDFWSWYIIVPVVLGLIFWRHPLVIANTTSTTKQSGEAETMGHVWDERPRRSTTIRCPGGG